MRIEDLNKVNYFDMLLLKAIFSIGYSASFKEIKPYLKIFAEKYGIYKLPNSRAYSYERLNDLCKLGLVNVVASDVIKTWRITNDSGSSVKKLVEGYFELLDKKEGWLND